MLLRLGLFTVKFLVLNLNFIMRIDITWPLDARLLQGT